MSTIPGGIDLTPSRPAVDPDAEVLVRAQGVSKKFARYHRQATSLKERLVRREQGESDTFWALRGVDVEVRRGETVGLMGPNGSGKSTLLKVLSGILRPNEGSVSTSGRVASLLELGAGFDGELTGRENIYLNSALLGVPRAETDARFDEIVEFSELGEFIEFPVKAYSSGMYVRLGFSVAVHVDPDILIVDEVLAVGDAAFQRKCLDRIELFQQQGKTILFVSHSADLVEQLCTRSVLLDHGRVLFDGTPRHAVARLNHLLGVDRATASDSELAKVGDLRIVDPETRLPIDEYHCGAAVLVLGTIEWRQSLEQLAKLSLHFNSGSQAAVVEVAPQWHEVPVDEVRQGRTEVEWLIDELPDLPGEFSLNLGVYTQEILIAHGRLDGLRLRGASARVAPGALTLTRLDEQPR
ncbi:MAG TPA: ABC transporter ATP-binding protein [Dermatophilaceae bacterium]|nr:ABC transporter ATP-binding protein [Dermatophilaceae bacterium]